MSWKVHLTWSEGDTNTHGTGFKIYRSVNGGSYSLVATVGISTLSWDDTNVSEGNRYTYHVTEYYDGNGGESPYASYTVYMPSSNTSIIVKVRIDGSVDVNWDQRTYNLGYRLERQVDGGAWALVTNTSTSDVNHVDSVGTTTGKTYKYRVRPIGTSGYAPAYKESDLHYYATKKVHVTWDEGGTGANQHGDGYKVYRKPDGGTYELWKTITGIETTSYDDPDITDGTYWYKVTEWKDDLEDSDDYAETSITVVLNSAPTAPTSLLCEGLSNPQAVTDLMPEFSAVYNDPDSGDIATQAYIQVNTSSAFDGTSMWDSGWFAISNVTAGNRCADISYAGATLDLDGSDYYWRIKFKDDDGAEGAWSDTASFRMRWQETVVKSEGVTIGDGDHYEGIRAFLEGIATNDGVVRSGIAERVKAEGLAVSEALFLEAERACIESIGTADTLHLEAAIAALIESVGVTDGDFAEAERVFNEAMSVGESMSRAWTASRSMIEALGIADALNRVLTRAVSESIVSAEALFALALKVFNESLTVSEGLVRKGDVIAPEGVGVSDITAFSASRTVADELGVDGQEYTTGQRAYSESMSLAEALLPLIAVCVMSENLTPSDGDHFQGERVLSEGIGVSSQAVSEGERSFIEALGATDSEVVCSGVARFIEALSASDEVKRELMRVLDESLSVLSAVVSNGERAMDEQIAVSDAEFISAVRALAESVSASEELKRYKILQEVMSLAEAHWKQFHGDRVGAEVVNILARLGLKGGSACTEPPYDCKTETGKARAKFESEVI